MPEPKKLFTQEFRDEAVRLAQTSGRSRRERQMDEPPSDRQENMAAELKRLRRENEVLRQEREILKRATAFFAKEGSR